mgnify:CR=1 FL=1
MQHLQRYMFVQLLGPLLIACFALAVLALLTQIRQSTGAALLMISHDLAVVRSICDVVHVMYQGRVVESGPCEAVFVTPRDDYTRELLAAMPGARWRSRR